MPKLDCSTPVVSARDELLPPFPPMLAKDPLKNPRGFRSSTKSVLRARRERRRGRRRRLRRDASCPPLLGLKLGPVGRFHHGRRRDGANTVSRHS